MLALAGRTGLGRHTRSIGLGDMGSELATSFGEAFFDYPGSFWCADWKHTCDYVTAAYKVLSTRFDGLTWATTMKQAIWIRDRDKCSTLLDQARVQRVKKLPRELQKCPVAALDTYLDNNDQHMRFAELKALGLPFVSARAEAQVHVRTKDRFSVAGAWCLENVEPKATLRAIIADGRWTAFRNVFIEQHRSHFERRLRERLAEAARNQRISVQQLTQLGVATTPQAHDAAA
jgi:hypothetical protein